MKAFFGCILILRIIQTQNLHTEYHLNLFCALSGLMLSIYFHNRAGYQQEVRLGLGFGKTDVLFNHILDSK